MLRNAQWDITELSPYPVFRPLVYWKYMNVTTLWGNYTPIKTNLKNVWMSKQNFRTHARTHTHTDNHYISFEEKTVLKWRLLHKCSDDSQPPTPTPTPQPHIHAGSVSPAGTQRQQRSSILESCFDHDCQHSSARLASSLDWFPGTALTNYPLWA